MLWEATIRPEIDGHHIALNSQIRIRKEGCPVDIQKKDPEIIKLIEKKQDRLENIRIHTHLLLGLEEVEETGICEDLTSEIYDQVP